MYLTPENTLKAFDQAIQEGADGIEIDIQLTKEKIPVITHNNNLNAHVAGAKRNNKDLGFINKKSLTEIKKYNVGQQQSIPTLEEVLNLVIAHNKNRSTQGLRSIIVFIDIKLPNTIGYTHAIVKSYIDRGLLDYKDIIYCTFHHHELKKLRAIDTKVQTALALTTGFLFGDENVDVNAGWIVPDKLEYTDESLKKITEITHEVTPVGYSAILWDIYQPLIDAAISNHAILQVTNSDIREYKGKDFSHIMQISDQVPMYFLANEPKKLITAIDDYKKNISVFDTIINFYIKKSLKRIDKPIKTSP